MTCIIGCVHNGEVYIGGDSLAVRNYLTKTINDEKVFIKGKFIFGFSGLFRAGQVIKYNFKIPNQKKNQSDMEYMVSSFTEACRKCFRKYGLETELEDGEKVNCDFLVGYKGKLYNIQPDYFVEIIKEEYNVVGSGAEVALGVMFATPNLSPKERITMALQCASKYNAGVAPPFHILKLPRK